MSLNQSIFNFLLSLCEFVLFPICLTFEVEFQLYWLRSLCSGGKSSIQAPRTRSTKIPSTKTVIKKRKSTRNNNKQVFFPENIYGPVIEYGYYDDDDTKNADKSSSQVKVILNGRGSIDCLDQGNFPHPLSCRKFISCAKIETGGVIGWEYTCPKNLSYDPVGGICNWASGLGCKD